MQVPLDRSYLPLSLEMRCLGSRAPSQAGAGAAGAAGAKPRPKARGKRRASQPSDPWSSGEDTELQEDEDEPAHASRTAARPLLAGQYPTQHLSLPPPPQYPGAAAGAYPGAAVAGPGAGRPKTLAEQQEAGRMMQQHYHQLHASGRMPSLTPSPRSAREPSARSSRSRDRSGILASVSCGMGVDMSR